MYRHLTPILVGLLLIAGCTNPGQSPSSDPFLVGRTRIPPPGTGEAAGRTADPGYSAPQASPSSPSWRASGTAAPAGTAATSGPVPVSSPGLTTGAVNTGGSAGQLSTPSGSAPPVLPGAASPTPGAPAGPGVSVPVTPPSGGAGFRGVSLQGSRSAVAPESRPPASTGTNALGASSDNRIPRPLDDGGAAGANAAVPKPVPGSAAPPVGSDSSGRVTDIGDLPTAL
jgi:hypothetical protein